MRSARARVLLAATPGAHDRLWTVAQLVVTTAFLVAWRGYDYGDSNHAVQIPLQRGTADPTLYARDLLMQSATGYTTYFFRALSTLERGFGHAEALDFILYVAGHLAVLGALHALARRLFGAGPAAAWACWLYVTRPPALGGEACYGTLLTHGHVATGILLWAAWLHLGGSSRTALASVGLAANLHALYALHFGALLGLDLVLRRRAYGTRRVAEALGLFVLAASPVLVWLVQTSAPPPAGRIDEWLAIMRERSPQHTFPLLVRPEVYGVYALLLGLLAACARLPARPEARRMLVHVAAGVALLCVIGLVGSEFVPLPVLIRAQLLRSTRWLTLLALPVLGQAFGAAWSGGGLARAGVALAGSGLLLGQHGLVGAALLLLLLDAARTGHSPVRIACASALLLLAVASGAAAPPHDLALGSAAELLRGLLQSARLSSFVVLLALACAARRHAAARGRLSVPLVAAALALALLATVARDIGRRRAAEPWYQVQRWCRKHTPRDALFLTPPYRPGFRVFSERAVVGEWKDGTQQFFSAAFGFAWRQRMRDLRAPGRGYDGLDASDLLQLGQRYGAEYAVTKTREALRLPLVYRNDEWAVYSLTSRP